MPDQDSSSTVGSPPSGDSLAEARAATYLARGWLPVAVLALVILVGIVLWQGRAQPGEVPTGAAALPAAPSPVAPEPTAVARSVVMPTPTPERAQALQSTAQIPALPTATPTLVQIPEITRTVSFSGNVTLRVALENAAFESSGRPAQMPVEPRSYVLTGAIPQRADQWCMQLGVFSLIFDVVFELDPQTQAVGVGGSLNLHDGFCDAVGEQRASAALDLAVPADAAAELVQSMQVNTPLLGSADLLDTSTGVFSELVISNVRPE